MADFLIPRTPGLDTVYGLSPLVLAICYSTLIVSQPGGINSLLLIRKLLCGGADADTLIGSRKALLAMIDNFHSPRFYYQGREIVELLLQHGANPRSPDGQQFEPLFYSIMSGNVTCTETLLRYSADPSCVGDSISALEPPTSEDEIPRPFQHKYNRPRFWDFQDHTDEMHDMLVKYKNPACIAPLCECKQKTKPADQ